MNIFPKRHTDCQQTHEKMLQVLGWLIRTETLQNSLAGRHDVVGVDAGLLGGEVELLCWD